jgi:hypothetical protein
MGDTCGLKRKYESLNAETALSRSSNKKISVVAQTFSSLLFYTMHVISVKLNSIIVCKPSSSSTIKVLDERWSPIQFSVSFDGLKDKPKWSLSVEDPPHEIDFDDDDICFFEGVLCVYGVVCCLLLCFCVIMTNMWPHTLCVLYVLYFVLPCIFVCSALCRPVHLCVYIVCVLVCVALYICVFCFVSPCIFVCSALCRPVYLCVYSVRVLVCVALYICVFCFVSPCIFVCSTLCRPVCVFWCSVVIGTNLVGR